MRTVNLDKIFLYKGGHLSDSSFCVMFQGRKALQVDINRFWSKTRREGECLIWCGQIMWKGYGVFSLRRHPVRAHRFAYTIIKGVIPDGLDVDHACHNRSTCLGGNNCLHRRCVEPIHLELATAKENVLNSLVTPARINADKTHCPKGHSYSGENLFVRKNRQRECRECGRAEARAYQNQRRIMEVNDASR
jgi:hypothetical protein